MEHIVELAISFDDKTVSKRIEENLYNDILSFYIENANQKFKKYDDKKYFDSNSQLDDLVEKCIKDVIDENKDEIIERASEKLAVKFSRTKAFKEGMKEKM